MSWSISGRCCSSMHLRSCFWLLPDSHRFARIWIPPTPQLRLWRKPWSMPPRRKPQPRQHPQPGLKPKHRHLRLKSRCLLIPARHHWQTLRRRRSPSTTRFRPPANRPKQQQTANRSPLNQCPKTRKCWPWPNRFRLCVPNATCRRQNRRPSLRKPAPWCYAPTWWAIRLRSTVNPMAPPAWTWSWTPAAMTSPSKSPDTSPGAIQWHWKPATNSRWSANWKPSPP